MTSLRVAILSLALVACGDKAADKPPPSGGSNGPGPAPIDAAAAAVIDAALVAPTVDADAIAADDAGSAAAPGDAGTKDEEEARKKRVERLERALERRRSRNLGP